MTWKQVDILFFLTVAVVLLTLFHAAWVLDASGNLQGGSLKAQVEEVDSQSLEDRVMRLGVEVHDLHTYLKRDPDFLLYLMDRDLDALENGREVRCSFTDCFMINAHMALKAGASKKEINALVDRVISLAEEGKYLSAFVSQAMQQGGGSEVIRSYAQNLIGEGR